MSNYMSKHVHLLSQIGLRQHKLLMLRCHKVFSEGLCDGMRREMIRRMYRHSVYTGKLNV